MDKIKLIKPTIEYGEDIMKYRQEFLDAGDSMDGSGKLRQCSNAEEWIQSINIYEHKETCPKDKVDSSTYIAVRLSDNKIVGIIDFRHHINHPILSEFGGHIGYCVRPSERRKGYATEILRLQLENCRNYGLDKVLITCLVDNIASEKTILANGGEFERIAVDNNSKKELKRFWIKL